MPKKKPALNLNKPKPAESTSGTIVIGQPMLDLSIWVYDADPDIVDFHANEICRAFLLHFAVKNFGVKAFGYEDEE
jgi:hypothetical protein